MSRTPNGARFTFRPRSGQGSLAGAMAFFQTPPALGNQLHDDRLLRSYLERKLDPDARRAIEPELAAMGELAGGELYALQLADVDNEPRLVQWDAWGHRVDRIEV